ncbi:MAG: ComF family protein [Sphaerochaetaceae bacterium]|nr:ComF family protein [Sphaerochaetaceae bacterium]
MTFNCKVCNKPIFNRKGLCNECEDKLFNHNLSTYMVRCPKCAYPLVSYDYKCPWCKYNKEIVVYSIADYTSPFQRRVLEQYKFKKDKKLSSIIGEVYYKEIQNSLFGIKDWSSVLFVPVPCSNKSLKIRGFDQMEQIGKYLQKKHRLNVVSLIKNNENTKVEQKELSAINRKINASSRFAFNNKNCKEEMKEKTIVLIDDIVTTGSTLKACTDILLKEGFNNVKCLTLFVEFNVKH